MLLSKAIPLAITLLSSVSWAQPNVAQCAAGFDWNRNSLGQDPCTVASVLCASCRGLTEYTNPPFTYSTQTFPPPAADLPGDLICGCNTVMYSLYMACASCQGGSIYPWTQWSQHCASVSISAYPANIPHGTTVPLWAYYDVTSLPNQTWNESTTMDTERPPQELLKRVVPTTPLPPSSLPPSTAPDPSSLPSKVYSTKTPTGLSGPTIPPPDTPGPATPTNNPGPATSTNTPQPANPTGPTDSPGPVTTPTNNADSPGPTTPNGNANSPGPTTPTGNTNSPGNATPLANANPSGSKSGTTGSPRPSSTTSRTTNSPRPTITSVSNSGVGDMKGGGINVWSLPVLLFLWTLV